VFGKITLQGKHTDSHRPGFCSTVREVCPETSYQRPKAHARLVLDYQPLPAISSASGMLEICLPTIGSPRLRLTSARMYGSL